MEEISLRCNCGDLTIFELRKMHVPTKYLISNTYEFKLFFLYHKLTFVAIVEDDRCKCALEVHSVGPAIALQPSNCLFV